MRVRRQRGGFVQRAYPDEAERRASAVVAPNCGVANAASIDVVGAAAFSGNCDRLGLARKQPDTAGFDYCVDYEGTARLPLTIAAVASIDKHRRG
jgi:hypothetical protein